MMKINFLILMLSALVPLVMGFIWYNQKVFGNAWMKVAEVNEEKMKGANMLLVFILTFVFSFLISFVLQSIVIHQWSVYSVVMNEEALKDPNSELSVMLSNFMEKYGNNFRTFKHGVLHGVITGFMLVLPILSINAMFERKGFKYIAINAGYWIITLGLMGGIICGFS